MTPGLSFKSVIVEKPQDYTFKAGHLIGLMVQTENLEWSLPKPYPGCGALPACETFQVDFSAGQTRVTLPIVGTVADPAALFASG